MKKKSIIKLAALCMSSVLLFAGCGKSGQGTEETGGEGK